MVLYIKPIPDILTVTINRERFTLQSIQNHERDILACPLYAILFFLLAASMFIDIKHFALYCLTIFYFLVK
jgi:hypothetical protein